MENGTHVLHPYVRVPDVLNEWLRVPEPGHGVALRSLVGSRILRNVAPERFLLAVELTANLPAERRTAQ